MNKVIKEQLDMLNSIKHMVDGELVDSIPDSFNEIQFLKESCGYVNNNKQVIFEDYIIKPFVGFDFHEKFNKGNPPPFKYMKGIIVKETEKMYYFKLTPNMFTSNFCNHCLSKNSGGYLCDNCSKLYNLSNVTWEGWCPKKSCKVN